MRLALRHLRSSLALVSLVVAGSASAEALRAPQFHPGDSWTYADSTLVKGAMRTTHDTLTLVRADENGIAMDVHAAGTPGAGLERLMGPNWSKVRSVDGRQVTVNQPLVFPLSTGKTWRVAYVEFTPSDRRHTREAWGMTMKASGWETVETPAGSFRALKIEGNGIWTADTAANVVVARGRAPNGAEVAMTQRNGPTTLTGRFYKVFWYVPEVRRWVKSQEDIFDSNGVRTGHFTMDLEAFALAGPHSAAQVKPEARSPAATAAGGAGGEKALRTAPRQSPTAPRPVSTPTSPLRETRRSNAVAG